MWGGNCLGALGGARDAHYSREPVSSFLRDAQDPRDRLSQRVGKPDAADAQSPFFTRLVDREVDLVWEVVQPEQLQKLRADTLSNDWLWERWSDIDGNIRHGLAAPPVAP